MSDIIHQLTEEGHDIREDDIAFLSPYMTEHIKRFGDYFIDIGQRPNQITEGRQIVSISKMVSEGFLIIIQVSLQVGRPYSF